MLTCKACSRILFNTLVSHALTHGTSPAILRPALLSSRSHRPRRYATATPSATAGVDERASSRDSAPPPLQFTSRDGASRDGAPPSLNASRSKQWAARKQLKYLKDPLHVATQVKRILDKGRFEEAALITRTASKDMKVAVSWNHLIDYQLRHERLSAAIKLYNEMKKRAQLPNAQTYTIIFRGCAKSPHAKLALSEAMKLYRNMMSSDRMKPNTVHLNAVLHVCAKSEDLDSMFSIIQTTNDSMRAPNNLTYTTILNALRAKAEPRQRGILMDSEVEERKAKAILRARAIWEEVISKWRAGSIIIDEELVCAMGRILLMGNYLDADSIEALIEQTMMIPREDNKGVDEGVLKTAGVIKSDAETKQIAASSPRPKIMAPGAPATTHALPGNNSLSLILSSIEKTGRTTKSLRYWGIFTKHYGVVPDAENWHQLLKVFRRGKSSSGTVLYFREMPGKLMAPKNVRIAMNTCLRDNLNHWAFKNATEVLRIMKTNFRLPEVQSLRTYLRVAHANKRRFEMMSKNDWEGAMSAWGMQISDALDNLWEPYQAVAKACGFDQPGKSTREEWERVSDARAEVAALARKMIAAYDKLITDNMIPSAHSIMVGRAKTKRNSLNRFVVAYHEDRKRWEPDFNEHAKTADEEDDDSSSFLRRARE